MKLKLVFTIVLLAFLSYSSLMANSDNKLVAEEKTMTRAEYDLAVKQLKAKVDMLQMAKKDVDTPKEKKAIQLKIRDVKKEAKELKAQAKGGIFISTGALVVIIILILIL